MVAMLKAVKLYVAKLNIRLFGPSAASCRVPATCQPVKPMCLPYILCNRGINGFTMQLNRLSRPTSQVCSAGLTCATAIESTRLISGSARGIPDFAADHHAQTLFSLQMTSSKNNFAAREALTSRLASKHTLLPRSLLFAQVRDIVEHEMQSAASTPRREGSRYSKDKAQ